MEDDAIPDSIIMSFPDSIIISFPDSIIISFPDSIIILTSLKNLIFLITCLFDLFYV